MNICISFTYSPVAYTSLCLLCIFFVFLLNIPGILLNHFKISSSKEGPPQFLSLLELCRSPIKRWNWILLLNVRRFCEVEMLLWLLDSRWFCFCLGCLNTWGALKPSDCPEAILLWGSPLGEVTCKSPETLWGDFSKPTAVPSAWFSGPSHSLTATSWDTGSQNPRPGQHFVNSNLQVPWGIIKWWTF